MTRKVVRGQTTTLTIGDPELGTSTWLTEYDTEFSGQKREIEAQQQQELHAARRSLRTPKSLKQGFVHNTDYQKLEGEYTQAVGAYRDLALQLATLEQRVAMLQDKEQEFMSSVESEHQAVATVRDHLNGLTDSLGRLLVNVEKNRSMMALLNNLNDTPPPEAVPVTKLVQDTQLAKHVSSLDARVQDLTGAVSTLIAEQRKLAAATVATARGQQHQLQLIEKQRRRRGPEKIDRLPPQSAGSQGFWKP